MNARTNIMNYTDFRAFLRDYVDEKKLQQAQWSLRVFARQLKVKSPSSLVMILNGQRNPGKQLTERMISYFKFSAEQTKHYRTLVGLSKSRGSLQKGVEALAELSHEKAKGKRIVSSEDFKRISNWYFYAIREMVRVKGFQEDAEWIRSRLCFAVSDSDIREAIETLLRLKLLKRTRAGKLAYCEGHIDTSHDVRDMGLQHYHKQILNFASDLQGRMPPTEQETSGGVFAIKRENLAKAKKLIRNFQIDLCNLLEDEDADSVFQIEVAFFPLATLDERAKRS